MCSHRDHSSRRDGRVQSTHSNSRHLKDHRPKADSVKVDNSFVTLPDLPGIGFEGKADLFKEMKTLSA